jgi:hypothetical protein
MYQDPVDAGGLKAVLQAACPGCDIEMRDARGAFGGFVAAVSRHDRVVTVLPLTDKRLFPRAAQCACDLPEPAVHDRTGRGHRICRDLARRRHRA